VVFDRSRSREVFERPDHRGNPSRNREHSATRRGFAQTLDVWLARLLAHHSARILYVNEPIADEWGRLNVPDPLPVIDGLLATTAKVHGLTLVTRNVNDVKRTGVTCIDPFEAQR